MCASCSQLSPIRRLWLPKAIDKSCDFMRLNSNKYVMVSIVNFNNGTLIYIVSQMKWETGRIGPWYCPFKRDLPCLVTRNDGVNRWLWVSLALLMKATRVEIKMPSTWEGIVSLLIAKLLVVEIKVVLPTLHPNEYLAHNRHVAELIWINRHFNRGPQRQTVLWYIVSNF